MFRTRTSNSGFTLAELLISLLIIGEIATFTIPKIINASANSKNASIAKDAGGMIASSFSTYTLKNTLSTSVGGDDLTQYMNYVKVDTATTYSALTGTALQACTATLPCLVLHTGGILQFDTAMTFGGSTTTHAVYFNLDPDGNGSQGRLTFIQFYTGRVSSGGVGGSATPTGGTLTRENTDPSYFSW